jgi:hypothetical protein
MTMANEKKVLTLTAAVAIQVVTSQVKGLLGLQVKIIFISVV